MRDDVMPRAVSACMRGDASNPNGAEMKQVFFRELPIFRFILNDRDLRPVYPASLPSGSLRGACRPRRMTAGPPSDTRCLLGLRPAHREGISGDACESPWPR